MGKQLFGWKHMAEKAFAVIGASLAALTGKAGVATITPATGGFEESISQQSFKAKRSPQLVLKLSARNLDQGQVVMHTSHSSHSSHASHASHASHYSSSPSYTPSYTPSTVPISTTPLRSPDLNQINTTRKSPALTSDPAKTTISKALPAYIMGSRTLFKGCRGTDVQELQRKLIALGYDVVANGYFDDTTKTALVDFQNQNGLKADGRVGRQTWQIMQLQ
jgi:His-Xaa-Ser repeat protein HxsA